MDFSLGLNQTQSLQQRMQLTAQMIHGLDLLQMPIVELNAQIDKELVENPVLEIEEPAAEIVHDKPDSEKLTTDIESIANTETFENFEKPSQLDSNFDEEQQLSYGNQNDDKFSKMDAIENTAEITGTLVDHVINQLTFLDMSDREKMLVEHLAYRLSAEGFFKESFEEIVENNPIEASAEEWHGAVDIMQSLEPDGIGAFGLQDSLLLQLKLKEMQLPLLEKLIKEYFHDVVQNRLPKVAKGLDMTITELKDLMKLLKHLNPKPGAAYSIASADIIKPDVIIEEVEGELILKISNEGIPRLGISSYYMELLDQSVDPQSKKYIKEKVSNAQKIIESISKRKETLYKISTELLRTQKDFFVEGVSGLKPLMMQEVADKVGMHVSTICRTVANKYLESPLGTYPLKYFFVNSSGSEDGSTTTQSVLQKIQDIIDGENKKKPLSDQAIVEILKRDELKLARRTVTKYREQLGVPSSIKRKEH
ncbi:MAG: RNA polymerase sigma-54 factor [Planctomycetota bacterium]|nr:MAG: RNA polymerase sigma-54 factor [Planctomycetota bacterium]